jgi:hypothetical protein
MESRACPFKTVVDISGFIFVSLSRGWLRLILRQWILQPFFRLGRSDLAKRECEFWGWINKFFNFVRSPIWVAICCWYRSLISFMPINLPYSIIDNARLPLYLHDFKFLLIWNFLIYVKIDFVLFLLCFIGGLSWIASRVCRLWSHWWAIITIQELSEW